MALCIFGNLPQAVGPTPETSAEERSKETGKGEDLTKQNQSELGVYFIKKLCAVCQSDAVVLSFSVALLWFVL